MATATKRQVEKVRMVEEKYTEFDGIVLELNKEEAALLTALIGHKVGGASSHVMNIYKALKSHVPVYGTEVTEWDSKMSGFVTVRG